MDKQGRYCDPSWLIPENGGATLAKVGQMRCMILLKKSVSENVQWMWCWSCNRHGCPLDQKMFQSQALWNRRRSIDLSFWPLTKLLVPCCCSRFAKNRFDQKKALVSMQFSQKCTNNPPSCNELIVMRELSRSQRRVSCERVSETRSSQTTSQSRALVYSGAIFKFSTSVVRTSTNPDVYIHVSWFINGKFFSLEDTYPFGELNQSPAGDLIKCSGRVTESWFDDTIHPPDAVMMP